MNKKTKNNLATKSDLKKLALKTDLKRVGRSLRQEILKVEARVEKIEEKVDVVDKKLDRIENKLDGFAGGVELLKQENSVGVKHTRELRVQVDDHESRLTTLESI